MIQIRKSQDRGQADHGWLKSFHTFSFADYYDPKWMGFRVLRVINEDFVDGGEGFDTHPHKDMEIITYVLSGALEHKDSMGTGSVIKPNDLQVMCAGRGVTHSEFNHSPKESVHLLQIWILPNAKNLQPNYQEKSFPPQSKKNNWCLLASLDQRQGSLKINQDVDLYCSVLDKGTTIDFTFKKERFGWLQVARGDISIAGKKLNQGDGAIINDETNIAISADSEAEILLFDLP